MGSDIIKNSGEILLYQTEDGLTRVEARMVDESVWLTQAQLSELFQRDRSVITKHIGNIFEEGELDPDAVSAKFAHTDYAGKKPGKSDVRVAKNYLNEEELDTLNRIVTLYLEFAELQAKNRKPMYMQDWITKLDDFLRISDRDILTHGGKMMAMEHANAEFDKFRAQMEDKSAVEEHFEESLRKLEGAEKQIAKSSKRDKDV
jgi:hypothetical protein